MSEMCSKTPSSELQSGINKQSRVGFSPLLVAAQQGHHEIITLLLQQHARLDIFDAEGKGSIRKGHEKFLKY